MPLDVDVSLSPGDFVLDGDPVPPPQQGGGAPKFSADVFGRCWIKMPLGTKVGLSPGDSVLDGNPAPLPTKGVEPPPQFWVHFYCGQTAGCTKMPLGMEVGLRTGEFVLDGDPAPAFPKRRRSPPGSGAPNFGPMFIVAKRLDGSRWHFAWR